MSSNKSSENHQFLCKFDALANLETRSFEVLINRHKTSIFIIRKNDLIFAYQNSCPHAKASLEWNDDDFLDETKQHIICAMHGATFSIEAGECLGGPCKNKGLEAVNVQVLEGDVVFD
ncbi:MAG TPA: Rieske (2Fe-2S) protein [Leucothrix mucor]|nr:Rieske (2Fe-2S) protein [Leucothrix mucor]